MKKIIVLLLSVVFVFTLTACKEEAKTRTKDNDSTSTTSTAVSTATSSAVTEESEEESEIEESIEESIVVNDDVYTDDSYSFTVPEWLTFAGEASGTATFKADDNLTQLNIQKTANTTGAETITKEELEASFSARFGEITLDDYQTGTVDGKNAVYCRFVVMVGTIGVNSYTMIVFTDETVITISLAAYGSDMEDEFLEMIDTVTIN